MKAIAFPLEIDDAIEDTIEESPRKLAIVSVSLADDSLQEEIDEIAEEYNGEGVQSELDEDVTHIEYQFVDPIDAEEFHEFLIGCDWFGDEVVSVAIHIEEEIHFEDDDNTDIIALEDDDCKCVCNCETCRCNNFDHNENDDIEQDIEWQELEQDDFYSNYIIDAGGFDTGVFDDNDFGFGGIEKDPNRYAFFEEETDAFNVQGQGGDVYKGGYSQQINELKKMVRSIFEEYKPDDKKSYWPNFSNVITCFILYSSGKSITGEFYTKDECIDFFENRGIPFSEVFYDEFDNGYSWVQKSKKEKISDVDTSGESLDETVDEDVVMGGYTVPLGAKPSNFKRNADVWRKNSTSKNTKAKDTVKSNRASTQSATTVKKDRKKAKAPFTSFADQSNVPFKHKSRTSKYGISNSPASSIAGE
jgi:hypothetical protein